MCLVMLALRLPDGLELARKAVQRRLVRRRIVHHVLGWLDGDQCWVRDD
jgi:hypothetical protein